MMKCIDIIQQIRDNSDTIERLNRLIKEPGPAYMAYTAGNYKDLPQEEKEKIKAAQAEHDKKICKASEEKTLMQIENRILHDNARQALFNEVIPPALAIWNKYAGKKYGPKTEDKIKDEIQAATGCRVYASRKQYGTGTELNISFPHPSPLAYFHYNDFAITPKWENGSEKQPLLSEDNKILPVDIENLHLWDCKAYRENVQEVAQQILQGWQEVKNKYDAFCKAASDYNALIPGKMPNVNTSNFRNYMEV